MFFIIIGIFLAPSLSASGKTDDAEKEILNNEWILLVTAFDTSALPPARRIAGDVMIRDLIDKLKTVNYRLRVSPEYAFYEGRAWRMSVLTAGRALAAKQDERSMLLYRGEPNWKYRQNLKRVDADIARLTEEYEKKVAEKPVVNVEPVFSLSKANIDGSFPAPPLPGNEYRFCENQKVDAFLTGKVTEFHGRFYIKLALYTVYSQSYTYEDDILFSIDDVTGAVEEMAARLTAALSGNKPAVVAVYADPPEAQILINQNYAGRGTAGEREYPPGKITVAVTAEGYTSETLETELSGGELVEIDVVLSPLQYSEVNIDTVHEEQDVFVYHGALFAGIAPLSLNLPVNQLEFISVEKKGGGSAGAVFTAPEIPGDSFDLTFKLKIPHGEHRVNNARKRAYWAWGGVWIAGIAAWIIDGIYTGQMQALQQSSSDEFYARTYGTYIVRIGALTVLGGMAVFDVFRMVRYLRTAGENSTPIVKREK